MSASSFTTSFDLPAAGVPVGDALPDRERRAARRFALALAFIVLTVLQVIAAINIAVDPFGYFGLNQVGFFFNSEREFKQQQIRTYPHRGLLLGNSKMAYVDPDLIEGGYRFFNAGFSGAKPDEILQFLEAHIEGLDYVALALDHRMFLVYEAEPYVPLERRWSDPLRYSLSLELLANSFESLHLWRIGEPSHYKPNGARTTSELQVRDYLVDGIGYWEKLDQREQEYGRLVPVFDERRIDQFRRIKRLLDRHGVAHVVFMNPLNVHEQEAIKWKTEWANSPSYKALVAELRRIFPGFRDYTTSRYSAAEFFWPTDFKHYRPEVGAEIISALLRDAGIEPEGSLKRIVRTEPAR